MTDFASTQKAITNIVLRLRRRKLWLFAINSSLLSIAGFLLAFFLLSDITYAVIFCIVLFALSGWRQLTNETYQALTEANLLEHYNRQFDDYEESAQLLMTDPGSLSLLERLQQKKIHQLIYRDVIDGRLNKHLPPVHLKQSGLLATLAGVLFIINWIVPQQIFKADNNPLSEPSIVVAENASFVPLLESVLVSIMPPDYSGIETIQTNELNLTLLQGTTVSWEFKFNNSSLNYYFVLGNEEPLPLIANSQGNFQFEGKIEQSTLYRLIYQDKNIMHQLPGVYSLAIIKDKAPTIRIIQPSISLVEIEKSAIAAIDIEASISDDYGLGEVSIIASVAKGSGEAVKFRDETFLFDNKISGVEGDNYQKHWSLTDLGMEPGDEVYFKIIAYDNREPIAQQTQSSSVIVRWLDEQASEMATEGIQIRYQTEYFRSQRQIIIETEQLIGDKKDLSKLRFEEKSTELGVAQRTLKEKYGQYLGDEVGDESGDEPADAHDSKHSEESEHKDESLAAHSTPEFGHGHEELVQVNDPGGASELIARFAHNHGAVEIAPMSDRDPKSWMKKAVRTMWQAEVYLMLSEPEKALPYEYEAYRYLKIARQAEKIYVKRLGFEPPPVSESNRLTGEMKDIENQFWQVNDTAETQSDQYLFRSVYQRLTEWPVDQPVSPELKSALGKLRDRFLDLAEERPVLIGYAATMERILIEGIINPNSCDNCVDAMKAKLWQLMTRVESLPNVREKIPLKSKQQLQEYLSSLEALGETEKINQSSLDNPVESVQ